MGERGKRLDCGFPRWRNGSHPPEIVKTIERQQPLKTCSLEGLRQVLVGALGVQKHLGGHQRVEHSAQGEAEPAGSGRVEHFPCRVDNCGRVRPWLPLSLMARSVLDARRPHYLPAGRSGSSAMAPGTDAIWRLGAPSRLGGMPPPYPPALVRVRDGLSVPFLGHCAQAPAPRVGSRCSFTNLRSVRTPDGK